MTGSGANNRDVKKINRIRTIRSIFSCDRISQPELAAKVNNSWPTVLQNVKELMAMGLVQEVGTFESTGGRKARAFAPVRDARLAVGLEITQNHVGAVLVDLSGNLLRYERKKRLYERSDTYAEMLAGIVQGLIEKEGYPVEKILGVGISLPGILDKEGQTLVYSHALGLRNVPTGEFSRYIPFSCRFINDANAAGLAEVRDLESPRSLVYLSLSNSVGGAILTGGTLYDGDHLRAGEFGHNTLVPDGRPCYCGKKGCLDAYCSAKVLSQLTDGNLALFFDGLRSGDAALQTAWNEYLSYLAVDDRLYETNFPDIMMESEILAELQSKPLPDNVHAAFLKTCYNFADKMGLKLNLREHKQTHSYCWSTSSSSNVFYVDMNLKTYRCTCTVGRSRYSLFDFSYENLTNYRPVAVTCNSYAECKDCKIGGFCGGGCQLSHQIDFKKCCTYEEEVFSHFMKTLFIPYIKSKYNEVNQNERKAENRCT